MMQRAPHNNILATPDYEEWKYYRKMTNAAFSPENIRKVKLKHLNQFMPLRSYCGLQRYDCATTATMTTTRPME